MGGVDPENMLGGIDTTEKNHNTSKHKNKREKNAKKSTCIDGLQNRFEQKKPKLGFSYVLQYRFHEIKRENGKWVS